MIDLAHSLGLAVVAQGVETAENFNLLKKWGELIRYKAILLLAPWTFISFQHGLRTGYS